MQAIVILCLKTTTATKVDPMRTQEEYLVSTGKSIIA